MSRLAIGVIAEDASDVEVIYELTRKLMDETRFSLKKFIGHGCGKLRRKCRAWATDLLDRGCARLVVVHDLDEADENELRTFLDRQIEGLSFEGTVVLIPIEEIEAWLLADPAAIKEVFRLRRVPKIPARPQKIRRPKEYLRRLVRQQGRAHYLNSVHNRKLAEAMEVGALSRCPSFGPYRDFISSGLRRRRRRRRTAS